MIPVVDLTRKDDDFEIAVMEAVRSVFRSGNYLLGDSLRAFEDELAAFCAVPDAVGVGSGTDALRLTLESLGVGAGDEVIVPAFGAVPTAAAVVAAGATPVLVDVDDETATLAVDAARLAKTERTAAVILVQLFGYPVDPTLFTRLNVPIVVDAAQAHGVPISPAATATTLSFYPTKNLGGIGDGGAVLTSDSGLANEVRLRRHHGMRELYLHEVIATNSRMSEIEAAYLRIGLTHLKDWNARRSAIAATYREAAPHFQWQAAADDHVYHLCVARFPDRDSVAKDLGAAGIGTAVHYPRAITQQPAYEKFKTQDCKVAEAWAREVLTLPCFPEMNDTELQTVCKEIAKL